MKDDDFRKWLQDGGAQTENGRNTRLHAIRTIERKLRELGVDFENLESVWASDHFAKLRDRLRLMRQDARDGGQDFRILMPESQNPHSRLSNWSSWLGQYGRFLSGEAPGRAKDADRIRQYVLEHYIEPGLEDGSTHVDVLVRDVNQALGLNQAWPNICQALAGPKFLEMAQVSAPERIGADQSSATIFRFGLKDGMIKRAALDQLRIRFLAVCPDFQSFIEPGSGWAREEKAYKVSASEKVRAAVSAGSDDQALGKSVFEILKTAAKDGPFVRWQTEDSVVKNAQTSLPEFYRAIGELVRTEDTTGLALKKANEVFVRLREQGVTALSYGERINILYSALAMSRPLEAAPLKITMINDAWKLLVGASLFVEAESEMEADYDRFAEVFGAVFDIARDEWNWAPQDWFDIQGFLWIALKGDVLPDPIIQPIIEPIKKEAVMLPVNLILYGPPGTGKTFATAAEAVRLCGEPVPSVRKDLMAVYDKLFQEKRIEFVTFHQSTSYEDFIEGRQPVTSQDETGTAGFRLETVPGIFRRMVRRVETSHGRSGHPGAISINGRQVFKMSIGEAANPEDAHLFEEAVSEGYTLLGFEDIDWSDDKFANRDEIVAACKAKTGTDDEPSSQSGKVQMPFLFRNRLKPGDIIVVSKGNSLFRAIGVVTGGYEFHPRPEGDYGHRRAVRWLWVDRDGVPVTEIHSRGFIMKTIYQLPQGELNIPALERYMNSQTPQAGSTTGPEQFVLIIDEINRANISKVFGELITLLEPDKRIGGANPLKVMLPYSGDEFGVPSNLHILGTMNTADRSIALLDTALRRRFEFRELMPDPLVLEDAAKLSGIDLPRLLANINERIEYLYDREHQIGHAYFVNCTTAHEVDAVMRHRVIPLLAEYFFEDWNKVAAVLGDMAAHESEIKGGFLNRSVLKPPPGLDSDADAAPRFRWLIRSEGDGFDYAKLLGA